MEPPNTKWAGLIIALLLLANVGYTHAPDVPQISDFIVINGNTVRGNAPMFSLYLPSYGALGYNVGYYDLMADCGWDLDVAFAVMWAESNNNPNAINWKDYHLTGRCWGSYGLFQLACFRGTPEELLDPETNIKLACELYEKKGWKPWGVCGKKVKCY